MLVGIIASIGVLSTVKTIRKRLEEGSLVMPQVNETPQPSVS
jgi:hypothetical protein